MWEQLTHDSLHAKTERLMSPDKSWCLRCGRPWSRVEPHSTQYTPFSACFPLCEDCWSLLGNPEARIEYYKMLIDSWNAECRYELDEEEILEIGKAVDNGG